MSVELHTFPLAADPAVPQRDRLLDDAEIARRLSSLFGLRVEACERIRTKYKIGESLRALYGVRVDGETSLVAARTFPRRRARDVYERAVRRAVPCGRLAPVVHDSELDAVFWTFPNDRKIEHLAALSASHGRRWTRSRLVAYAPEKCATAQCLDDRGRTLAYAKTYADDEGLAARRTYDAINGALPLSSRVSVARAAGYSEESRTLFLEPVDGRRIADLAGEELESGFRHLGAALAVLHGAPAPDGLPIFRRSDVGQAERAAALVGRARPDVDALARRLARALTERWTAPTEPPVCLHGDVHPKNGILRGDGVGLVDLDQAGVGPAAADVGSLLAGLRCSGLTGLLAPALARDLGPAFLSGYASVRALPDADAIAWHTSAAMLVERALRAVNRVRAPGLLRLDALLADAERLLEGGRP